MPCPRLPRAKVCPQILFGIPRYSRIAPPPRVPLLSSGNTCHTLHGVRDFIQGVLCKTEIQLSFSFGPLLSPFPPNPSPQGALSLHSGHLVGGGGNVLNAVGAAIECLRTPVAKMRGASELQ